MQLFSDQIIRGLLANSLETATVDESGWCDVGTGGGSNEGEFIDWLTFQDLAESDAIDVKRIRNHPLVPPSISIYGYIYDVKTGRLLRFLKPQK